MQLTLSVADGGDKTPFVIEIPNNPRLESEVLIGRANDCDLQILKSFVSRHHCGIVIATGEHSVRIRDLGSRNGTFVNDSRVIGLCNVEDGDMLTVGFLPLRIEISESSSAEDRVVARHRAACNTKPRQMDLGAMRGDDN